MKIAALSLLFIFPAICAAGTTTELPLLETPNARPSALGEAFSAMSNDISGLTYNPGSLATLENSHASFMYQQGIAEDSFGQLMLGAPSKNGGLGLSIGYYNAGDITLFDGTTEKTVNAKTDLTATLGLARNVGDMSIGIAGKYISSQLIEANKATAMAIDAGLQMALSSSVRFGAAVQNIGSKLKYVEESYELPQIARAGMAFSLFQKSYPTTLAVEAPYYINDSELRMGLGIETIAGPLAFRAGYRMGDSSAEMTFGAGFMLGSVNLDYAYGLVQDFEASHRVSVGMRFGQTVAQKNVEPLSYKYREMITKISLDPSIRRAMYE